MAWVADARVGFGLLAFATARFSLGADPVPELADLGRRLAPRCVLFGGEPLGEGPHVVEPVLHHDRGARDAVAGDRVSRLGDERRANRRLCDRGERDGVRALGESDRCTDGREVGDRYPARDEDEVRGLGGGKRCVARVRGGIDGRDLGTGGARGFEDGREPRGLGADDRGRRGLAPVAPGGG